MEKLLNPAIAAGPIVLGLGLAVAIGCFAFHLLAPRPGPRRPLLRFVLVLAAVGVAAFIAGTVIGIAAFCSTARTGNLCGLGGVFGVGPMLSGSCMGGYALFWVRRIRRAT